ncbi:hypothetical protein Calab_1036 [Caldithrix abyssi DSM 13497]|uniref:DUF3800 domain-containing protein n=1 Tax=Caldithrix abyssi DSM 13497 TaxID=880073 RepID=H1XVU3_CALAY|nr:DUF3800 domain-containing protein [Caldithrix abyssi]APF20860.1 Protein of unknown function (DUF3800) [Caldithrix abyssi DSM 13497]EHO40670.1 hypothetical protein Calab_1036 [Caldithrix abyssi DSM 13497]
MSIFFAFSDENGQYQQQRSRRFLRTHPYYIRATFLINGSEWKLLSNEFFNLKIRFNLPVDKEIKWSYLWSIRHYQINNKPITSDCDFYFLKDIDYHVLINFVESSLAILNRLSFVKIIYTVTFNNHCPSINETNFYKMHLQDHMQRIEMELQNEEENLSILFFDPISREKNELLRNAYNLLYLEGDFIERYSHIKDSINFENSHHSVGIQIADYIAGIFSGFLKNYSRSKEIFDEKIKPYIRKNSNNDPFGFGIREVPSNQIIRERIRSLYFD